ncbi:MAG TPA: sigma 54-interacting transcriptional regulator [Syntrophomonadaceae bacterium]|nr:sigma 54-interacting transcriptional regulator [Syntrophomonadaceae bacterium]
MTSLKSRELDLIAELLLNSPFLACVVVDKEGKITFISQSYLEWLDMKGEDVLGRYILDVTPDSGLPEVLQSGKAEPVDIWSINDRSTIVTRMPLIKDGQIVGAIGQTIFLEMAGATILKKKLQEMEKEYTTVSEALVQSPYMVYVIVDQDGIITFMNQTYLDLLEMQKEDVVGKHVLEITPHSQLPDILKTGEIHEVDTWTINGRDTIITRTPIIKDGEITGAIGRSLFLDMSAAKKLVNKLQEIEKELNFYKEEVRQIYSAYWQFKDLIGQSSEFVWIRSMAQQLSNTRSTILITGESGTGKELFAQAIHNNSKQEGPFVRINCAALPENLLESELFGYEEGAFTGAKKGGKPGKFELAKGGTIFLDEIGDMPLTMQTKLLSVLQERTIERVGGTSPIPIQVRVIAATNRDLEKMVANREFREDLYYRLNVVRLNILPLRKRLEDLPLLVEDLMTRINSQLKTDITQISEQAMNMLSNYSWPGNVRELENLLERAINLSVLKREKSLTCEHFPSLFEGTTEEQSAEVMIDDLGEAVERLEKEMIERVLEKTGKNKTWAAKILGLNKSVLYRKMKKYNIAME